MTDKTIPEIREHIKKLLDDCYSPKLLDVIEYLITEYPRERNEHE